MSISFISSLVSIISFLLLTLSFVCSSFPSFFRCKVRLFIWDFSYFLTGMLVSLWTSLLELLLLHHTDFGTLCFHFHLSPGIFLFPLWFLQWSVGSLVAYCLASTCLWFSAVLFLIVDSQSYTTVDGKDAWYDFNLKFIETCGGLAWDLSWRMFHVHLKIICILLFFNGMFYIYIY